jgi:hypothetical protein
MGQVKPSLSPDGSRSLWRVRLWTGGQRHTPRADAEFGA